MILLIYIPIMILISYFTKGKYFELTDLMNDPTEIRRTRWKYLFIGISLAVLAFIILVLIFKALGLKVT